MAPKRPSLLEWLLVPINTGRIILAVILRLLSRPFVRGNYQKSVLKDALYAGVRQNLMVSSLAQEQALLGTTEGAYHQITRRNKVKPDIQVLDSGVKLYWIGARTAKKVFLYFHGGGYVLPSSPGHWQLVVDLQQGLSKDHDFSVCALGYTLAPELQYPGQLKEAVEALAYLFEQQHRKPGEIFVGGDSAGGNLTLAVLSHLLHPHPEIPTDLRKHITEPLLGAILISPWCQFMPHSGSADTNVYSDYVSSYAARRWSTAFQGKAPTDNYLEPCLADATWFYDIEKVTKDILVWGGGSEVLIDNIKRMTKLLESVHPRTELVVQPGAAHEDFIITRLLHITAPDDHAKLIQAWMAARS